MAESRNWEEVYTAQAQAIERLTREREEILDRVLAILRSTVDGEPIQPAEAERQIAAMKKEEGI